jgi:hypothetical protein
VEEREVILKEMNVSSLPKDHSMTDVKGYVSDNGLIILCSIDVTPKWGPLKHVSVSHPKRLPFWHDVVEIKETLMGDVDCMLVMPKSEDYINLHKYCFNIWQCPEGWGIR